jgi:hypothetical protein
MLKRQVLKKQVLTYASLANACLPQRGKRASKQHLLYLGLLLVRSCEAKPSISPSLLIVTEGEEASKR